MILTPLPRQIAGNHLSTPEGNALLCFLLHTSDSSNDDCTIQIDVSPAADRPSSSPYLWNQLPSSFRQPHLVHSPPGSPRPVRITSSQCMYALAIYHSLVLSLQT